MKENQLILIASQPRAGSTYLQNLLSNNEFVNTCSESWLLLNFANQIKPELINATFDNNLAQRAFKDYLNKFNIDFLKKQKQYLFSLYDPMLEGYSFIVDKTPRYWEILDEMIIFFPKSKIIIIRRNPLDVLKSMITTWDISSIERLNEYRNDLLKAPFVIDNFINKHRENDNVIVVDYEKLINDKEYYTKELYSKIGLPYDNSALDTSKNSKYKGHFGDPYQNNLPKKRHDIPNFLEAFITGYANYLGEDFFIKHNYKFENSKQTRSFDYFLQLGDEKNNVSLKGLKKELILLIRKKLVYFNS